MLIEEYGDTCVNSKHLVDPSIALKRSGVGILDKSPMPERVVNAAWGERREERVHFFLS